MDRLSQESIIRLLVQSGAAQIRDLSREGVEPFLYSSGWRGPGYLTAGAALAIVIIGLGSVKAESVRRDCRPRAYLLV